MVASTHDPAPPTKARVVPMYVRLLEAVLSDQGDPASSTQGPVQVTGALSEVVRLRHDMDKHAHRSDPGWALQAVADQLAYDAALVRWGRRRGFAVELDGFDVPERGRALLEEAMTVKGVHVPARSAMSSVHSWPRL